MSATAEDVKRWIDTAIRNGSKYVVSVCDTFSYDDYPVYCDSDEELEKAKLRYNGGDNMQRINEVITVADHVKVSDDNEVKGTMSVGEYMRILSNCAIRYKSSGIAASVKRNEHMNELRNNAHPVNPNVAEAVVVDFVNFVAAQMGMDYGMYTKDLNDKERK